MIYDLTDAKSQNGLESLSRTASAHPFSRRHAKGFTLIELLVVIALTITLLALLFGPLIAGFQYTSRAQTVSAAQSGQRLFMESILRDLTSAAGVRDTQGKFENVMILQKAGANDTTGTQVLAHLYNGYTDVVPPMPDCQDPATFTKSGTDETCHGNSMVLDPTTHLYTVLTTGTAAHGAAYGTNPGIVTPIAPGTAITRYFVGLRYPISLKFDPASPTANAEPQPYNNIYDNEGEQRGADTWLGGDDFSQSYVATEQLNNTYIIYIASVQPYKFDTTTSTYLVDNNLFQSTDSTNTKPVLDDPDFFRIVTTADYLPATDPNYTAGGKYTLAESIDHNKRVYYWYKAAHQAITGREYDVMAFARSGGDVTYADASSTANPLGSGNYGFLPSSSNNGSAVTFDTANPVNGGTVPIVRSTFNLGAAGAQNEAMQAQSTSDVSQAQDTTDQNTQLAYLPSLYRTSQGQIQGSPTFAIKVGAGVAYTVQIAGQALANKTLTTGTSEASDLVETNSSGTLVYDVTKALAASGTTAYVPVSFNPTDGSLSFATTATPPAVAATTDSADNTNSHNPWWYVALNDGGSTDTGTSQVVDLANATQFPDNPFNGTAAITPLPMVVPNSERVMGPDQTPGPAKSIQTSSSVTQPIQYNLIPYTRVSSPDQVKANQYYIDYRQLEADSSGNFSYHPVIYLGPSTAWTQVFGGNDPTRHAILVSYAIQNNYTGTMPASLGTATNSNPFGLATAPVTASYASGNSLKVTVGFRVYDTNSKQSAFITSSNTASLGNGLR